MNINDYRRAMDQIVPDNELKERIMNQTKKNYIPIRRTFTVLLAAVLTTACLLTAAFAASPELRTAVLSFFHMEEPEQVPSQSLGDGSFDISQTEIGELVKAQYIQMDRYYGFSNGLLTDLTWSEDWKTLVDAKFWDIKDNTLVPVEVELQTSQIDITFRDIRYQGEFYWFVRDGQLNFFSGDHRDFDEDGEHEWDWNLSFIPGRTDAVLLRLSTGRQVEYTEYPFLYHLDTGEMEDLLAGADPSVMAESDGATWSDSFQLALITSRASEEFPYGREWLYDRAAQTLTDVSTLGGVDADVAVFADDDTLILTTYTTSEEDGTFQTVTSYAYKISSGTLTKTLDQAHYYRWWEEEPYGAQLFGKRCVYITEAGQVQIINLATGVRTIVENFTFQTGDNFMVSSSGDKVLYYSMDSGAEGLGITRLGVINLEKGVFIAFDRDGYENLHEEGIGWQDDNTVSINATTPDGETRYLILYQF